jgi:hypothetical protein
MSSTGSHSRDPGAAPRDPYHIPHRKNAAEWMMWAVLLPLVPFAHLLERLHGARGRRHG